MAEWSDGFVNANGLNIHYYRTGGDKPAVIFNHGAGDDGLCWTRVARALQGEYDIIMPDARGHGKSASGKGAYASALRVADLACLVEELRLDRPVIGGHSMGADTALNFAAVHPGQTRGIFLEDPPMTLPGEMLFSGGKAIDVEKMGKMMITAMRLFKLIPNLVKVPMLKKMQPGTAIEEIVPMANAQKRVSYDFINAMLGLAKSLNCPVELFARVSVPVLLIIGDKQKMSIVSPEAAAQAREINPLVEIAHLEGASHNIRRDRFDGYMQALKAFLQAVYA